MFNFLYILQLRAYMWYISVMLHIREKLVQSNFKG